MAWSNIVNVRLTETPDLALRAMENAERVVQSGMILGSRTTRHPGQNARTSSSTRSIRRWSTRGPPVVLSTKMHVGLRTILSTSPHVHNLYPVTAVYSTSKALYFLEEGVHNIRETHDPVE
jgi:hypothetical protein